MPLTVLLSFPFHFYSGSVVSKSDLWLFYGSLRLPVVSLPVAPSLLCCPHLWLLFPSSSSPFNPSSLSLSFPHSPLLFLLYSSWVHCTRLLPGLPGVFPCLPMICETHWGEEQNSYRLKSANNESCACDGWTTYFPICLCFILASVSIVNPSLLNMQSWNIAGQRRKGEVQRGEEEEDRDQCWPKVEVIWTECFMTFRSSLRTGVLPLPVTFNRTLLINVTPWIRRRQIDASPSA